MLYLGMYDKNKGQRESGFLNCPTIKVRGGTKMDNSNYNSIIWLTQGKYAIVDNDDYKNLSRYKWCSLNGLYARRVCYKDNKPKNILMHRLIIETPNGFVTDHINGNGLDNRKCNLRVCTQAENAKNRKPHGATSQYKGVSFCSTSQKWKSYIRIKNKQYSLGYFSTEKEAAMAYDLASKKHYGVYGKTNKDLNLI